MLFFCWSNLFSVSGQSTRSGGESTISKEYKDLTPLFALLRGMCRLEIAEIKEKWRKRWIRRPILDRKGSKRILVEVVALMYYALICKSGRKNEEEHWVGDGIFIEFRCWSATKERPPVYVWWMHPYAWALLLRGFSWFHISPRGSCTMMVV